MGEGDRIHDNATSLQSPTSHKETKKSNTTSSLDPDLDGSAEFVKSLGYDVRMFNEVCEHSRSQGEDRRKHPSEPLSDIATPGSNAYRQHVAASIFAKTL